MFSLTKIMIRINNPKLDEELLMKNFWYRTNDHLRDYIDSYYYDNGHRLKFYEDLYKDSIKRYEQGIILENKRY